MIVRLVDWIHLLSTVYMIQQHIGLSSLYMEPQLQIRLRYKTHSPCQITFLPLLQFKCQQWVNSKTILMVLTNQPISSHCHSSSSSIWWWAQRIPLVMQVLVHFRRTKWALFLSHMPIIHLEAQAYYNCWMWRVDWCILVSFGLMFWRWEECVGGSFYPERMNGFQHRSCICIMGCKRERSEWSTM